MPKQTKDQPGEEPSQEHGTAETQLEELKRQNALLHARIVKLEERLTKLENPVHIERAVAKHLKRNLGISGQPARGDQA